jgi:predicted nucleic acid-binding protein
MSIQNIPVIIDTATLINLNNSKAIDFLCQLKSFCFYIGNIVLSECHNELCDKISNMECLIKNFGEIPLEYYISILEEFNLGSGESECLCYGKLYNFSICTDDKKARRVGTRLLGESRVIGSIGLLKELNKQSIISREESYFYYLKMKSHGGFLPEIERNFFEN